MLKPRSPLMTKEKEWSTALRAHEGGVEEPPCLANSPLAYFELLLRVIIFRDLLWLLRQSLQLCALWKDIWIRHISRISIPLVAELQHLFHMLLYLVHWLISNSTGFCRVYYGAVRWLINIFLHLDFKKSTQLYDIQTYRLLSSKKPLPIPVLCTVTPVCLCIPVLTEGAAISSFSAVVLKKALFQSSLMEP